MCMFNLKCFDILSMSKGQRIRVMITTVVVLTTWFCDWTDKNTSPAVSKTKKTVPQSKEVVLR